MTDYASITEYPGTLLSPEQWQRFRHRYAFGLRESELMRASERAAKSEPVRILEVGCGTGVGLAAWLSDDSFVVGLEYIHESLPIARQNLGKGAPLLCGDAQYLPLADGSFDVVASFEVIYYLPNPALLIAESRRMLAPGGKLILCWSNPQWSAFAPGRLSGRYPTLAEVAGWLAQAGFGDARFYGAFPSDAASGRQQWTNRLRQLAVRTGMTRMLGTFTAPLMRAAYGELTPLPARLDREETHRYVPEVTPLDPDSSDSLHRVLYVVASRASRSGGPSS